MLGGKIKQNYTHYNYNHLRNRNLKNAGKKFAQMRLEGK